jgi:tetratricopeptide (TPR) repeat protein
VGQTIRICSIALVMFPALVEARRAEPSTLGHYVRARVADQRGQSEQAVRSYAAALASDPENVMIASRAYRVAVDAGTYALAVRSAQTIDIAGVAPPDAHILLYILALKNRDWRAAEQRLTVLAREPGLGFLAPLFGRWLEAMTRMPLTLRAPKQVDRTANAYITENDALVALSKGDVDDAVVSIKGLWTLEPYRAGSLRLAAADQLVKRNQKARAIELIVADDVASTKARTIIENGGNLGVSVSSPLEGAAFMLARVAGDLIVEGSDRSGLTIARLAAFAAPKNARIKLMVAGALSARKDHEVALAIVDTVIGDPLYGDDAASFRIEQLEELGQTDTALTEARARAVASPNDLARVGDIELRRGNFSAAAAAYQRALSAQGANVGWTLVFAAANAYDSAGDWAAAKPLLERALAMAPDEPAILNELGYGLIMHGGDLDRGITLIAQAAALRPDDAAIVDSLGWAAYKRGAFGQAIPLLERAVRLDQTQAEIGEHLGDAYWAAGRKIDARYAWSAARVHAKGEAEVRLDGKIAGKH